MNLFDLLADTLIGKAARQVNSGWAEFLEPRSKISKNIGRKVTPPLQVVPPRQHFLLDKFINPPMIGGMEADLERRQQEQAALKNQPGVYGLMNRVMPDTPISPQERQNFESLNVVQPANQPPATQTNVKPQIGQVINQQQNQSQTFGQQLESVQPTGRVQGAMQVPAGNLPQQNFNPGNIRDSRTGEFKKFESPQSGFAALSQDLTAKITGNSPMTEAKLGRPARDLFDVVSVYAPKEDGNDPDAYAEFVANLLGISKHEPVENLRKMLPQLIEAFARKEGYYAQ